MEKIVPLDFAIVKLKMKNQVVVNQEWQWSFEYTATKTHPVGTMIKIVVPAYQHQRSEEYLQTYNFWKPNYIYVNSKDGLGVDIEVKKITTRFKAINDWVDSNRVGLITLHKGLKVGDKFEVNFGGIDRCWLEGEAAPSYISQFAPFYPETKLKYEFMVNKDGKEFVSYNVFDEVVLLPEKAEKIKLYCESSVKPNIDINLKYVFCDRFNNPIFNKKLSRRLSITNLVTNKIEFLNIGQTIFKLENEGSYLIDIENSDLKVDKAIVRCVKTDSKIYWGDLHNHSNLSANIRDNDFNATPDNCYDYGRKTSHLDYICLSEQTHKINNDHSLNVDNETWSTIGNLADAHNETGKFVAFGGVELHSKRGDTVVLFKDNLNKYPYPKDEISEIDQIWNLYEDIITIPHFHVYSNGRKVRKISKDYLEYNSENWLDNSDKERLGEVFSSQWGRFENLEHPMVLKARNNIKGNTFEHYLNTGHKWGITASSDMHDGRPGYGGLTAVRAESLTREDIYQGLISRRTYATTGPRFYMNFEVKNDEFNIDTLSPMKINEIELIGDGEVLEVFKVDDFYKKITIKNKYNCSYYYLRVRMEKYHIGWSEVLFSD
jgi:hypothetical protein